MLQWVETKVSVSALKPYERNPRTITKAAYEKLKDSLKFNGYHQRIIATRDLRIIGGHMRIKALQELGFLEIAVLIPNEDITDEQFKRILIQDNLPFGTFDMEILSADFELPQLLEWGMPEDWLIGMKKKDFDDEAGNETPELQVEAISKPGDLWKLGPHRLLCGDATDGIAVLRLLNGVKPNLMVTDPPYGVEYDADWRNKRLREDGTPIGGRAIGKVENDDQADWREAFALFPGNIVYAWCASLSSDIAITALESCGFKRRAQIIWAKNNFAIGRGDYQWQHEPCWYAVKNKGDWHGDRSQTTLWNIPKPQKSETGHSTQKPVECMRKPMLNNSSEGQTVYDPFLGSSTSIIAAEQCGRVCFGLEISPAYADLGVRRWQQFTQKKAVLDGTEKTFDEIEKDRFGVP